MSITWIVLRTVCEPSVAVMIAHPGLRVAMVNCAEFRCSLTLAGTVAMDGLLLDSDTSAVALGPVPVLTDDGMAPPRGRI